MKDCLGDRMKKYENNFSLPDNLPVIIRIDGKCFHTVFNNYAKPFDNSFIEMMDDVATWTIAEIQNARMAYIQSDEISFLLYKKNLFAQPWFGNDLQKLVSVTAGIASSIATKYTFAKVASFDARAFILPLYEVPNYFIWRQKDWTRNSIQMLARSLYSQKELHKKSVDELHDMIHSAGKNWNNLSTSLKRGRCVVYNDKWIVDNEIPVFTEDRGYITRHLVMEDD